MAEKSNPLRILAVLYGAAFVAAFNENIINVALIDIMAEMGVDSVTSQWLVTGYMIVASIVVASMSFLSRRFSLRALFFTGGGIFLAGSVAAFFAPSFPLLLAFRLVQAVGTGIFIPTMMGTVLAVSPRQKLGTYLSVGSCCITLGPAFGPVVSGVMVTALGWRGIFIPPCVVMAVLVAAGIPMLRNLGEVERPSFDPLSLALSAVGVTAVVFGLTQVTSSIVVALVALAIGVLLVALFARRQMGLAEPMMNVRPALKPRFSLAVVMSVIAMMETFSMSVLMPLYFQGALGYNALMSGVFILIPIAFNAVAAIVGGRMMDALGEWPLLPLGFLLILGGQAAVCLLAPGMDIAPVVVAAAVVYAGVGLVMSPAQTAGLKRLSREEHPHGVGMVNTFTQMAGALGPSLFVGILSSGAAGAVAGGATAEVGQAIGFASAALVASVVGAVGFAIAAWYAWTVRAGKNDDVRKDEVTRTIKPAPEGE